MSYILLVMESPVSYILLVMAITVIFTYLAVTSNKLYSFKNRHTGSPRCAPPPLRMLSAIMSHTIGKNREINNRSANEDIISLLG